MFKKRIALIAASMGLSVFSESLPELDRTTVTQNVKNPRKPQTQGRFNKPPTKAKFKQNQRKQRKASVRKKAK